MAQSMYRTIMVPLDGSEFSRHAIPWALSVARPAGAAVHLVHVMIQPFGMGAVDEMTVSAVAVAEQRARELSLLEALAGRLSVSAGVAFTASVEEGDPGHALDLYAERHAVDLIVMTSHGRGVIGRAALGSVSDALVRRTRLPVLIARPHSNAPDEREAVEVSEVLVPLDGSSESETVVDHAIELGALTGASCTLLHVYVAELLNRMVAPDALTDEDAVAADEATAEAHLARIAERFRARGVAATVVVLRGREAASGIVEYCASHPVSLIAMSTRGRAGVARVVLGSAATTLLEKTRLPMLLVRA